VCIDDPTACRIVKALSERGLVTSEPDPRHGRRILIRLAPGSQDVQDILTSVSGSIRKAVERGLDAEEKEALRRTLMKVIANMDAIEPPAPEAVTPLRARRA
jgi:DNA-binding MarR family transcriptional regulator